MKLPGLYCAAKGATIKIYKSSIFAFNTPILFSHQKMVAPYKWVDHLYIFSRYTDISKKTVLAAELKMSLASRIGRRFAIFTLRLWSTRKNTWGISDIKNIQEQLNTWVFLIYSLSTASVVYVWLWLTNFLHVSLCSVSTQNSIILDIYRELLNSINKHLCKTFSWFLQTFVTEAWKYEMWGFFFPEEEFVIMLYQHS